MLRKQTTLHQQFIAVSHVLRKLTTLHQQFIAVSHVTQADNFTPAVYCDQSCVTQADNFTPSHRDQQIHAYINTHTHTHRYNPQAHSHKCTHPTTQTTHRAFCTTLFTRKLYMWQQNLAVDEHSLDHRNTLHQAGDETVFKPPPCKHITMVSDSWLITPLPVVPTLLASLHAP